MSKKDFVESLLDNIIKKEGGYCYFENDRGGPTCWGITEAVARDNGYTGDMKNYPVEKARAIYKKRYYLDPKFDKVAELSQAISEELTDTGVNMGTTRASKFLQQCLNAFNKNGVEYPDMVVDGKIGPTTLKALKTYLEKRKNLGGEEVMLKALNVLQGAKYIEIAEHDRRQESFVFGWLKNRVSL